MGGHPWALFFKPFCILTHGEIMNEINTLREQFPDAAKDIKLNLSSVLDSTTLTSDQSFGVAICSAMFLNCESLKNALIEDAFEAGVGEAVIDDAKAAAAIMAMNTIYYRFRHMANNPTYGEMNAKLRMSRMAKPATDKGTFELMSMAIAVLEGCEMCVNAHDKSIQEAGLSAEHVHETVRIAAVIKATSIALTLG